MSEEERKVYTDLIHFLGKALGSNTEVVLHDFCGEESTIVAIENGHISGRKVGDEPSEFTLQIINNKDYANSHRINFSSVAHGGKMLRSSTFFIRNEDKTLKGMICINMDVSAYAAISEQIRQLAGIVNVNTEAVEENANIYLVAAKDAILESLNSLATEMSIDIPFSRLTAKEKQSLVIKLQEKGLFNLKGAVAEVAGRLEVSEPTIYRYLTKTDN